ncbi:MULTISPECIES: hypothetical protein [Pseudomonas]|uniref:Uncharacterized protein n=1 Tax=Pseudomonas azadiae TaxID=2843612 RepID=A0ABS6P091_9PSED|nr:MULTISPECIES: hypothetical protein [Pseudomonas]MBV4453863.1 hypothetical protein [Pseudomonas azadiae]NMF42078.1 hypothetical protein [Pseudomonas sp. SWRI 103]
MGESLYVDLKIQPQSITPDGLRQFTDRYIVSAGRGTGFWRQKNKNRKKMMSFWFFCHSLMLIFAPFVRLLRRIVARKWSFTQQKRPRFACKAEGERA